MVLLTRQLTQSRKYSKEMAREAAPTHLEQPHKADSTAQGMEKEQLKQIEQMREYFSQFIEEYEEVVENEEENANTVSELAEPAGICFCLVI